MARQWLGQQGQQIAMKPEPTLVGLGDDGLTEHCGCCSHSRRSGCGGPSCPCTLDLIQMQMANPERVNNGTMIYRRSDDE